MLRLDEIEPGIVAWLDTAALFADSRVRRFGDRPFRAGPFLCVVVGPGTTSWLNLTTRSSPYPTRMLLRPQWWLRGVRSDIDQFINDVREPWIGRDVAFVDASHGESPVHIRPQLNWQGLNAVHAMMAKYPAKSLDSVS